MSDDDHNDIDELMSIDPLSLSKQDLDRIIAYQRKQRAMREQGVKVKKPRMEVPAGASLSELLSAMPKAPAGPSQIKRR